MVRLQSALVAIVFSAVLCSASAAYSQPVPWERVDVTAHSEGAGAVVLVTGTLPQSAELPAKVELSVPAGAELQWSGEILGGPLENDPAVEPTKATRDGIDVYAFTLSKSRQGQIEARIPAVATPEGSRYAAAFDWASSQPVATVQLSIGLPQGASVVQPAEGATLEPAEGGRGYYTRTFSDVGAGEPVGLAFAYSAPATPAAQTRSTSGALVPALLGVGVLLAGVGLYRAVSRKLAAKAALASGGDDAEPPSAQTGAPGGTGGPTVDGAGDESLPESTRRRFSPPVVAAIAVVAVVAGAAVAVSFGSGAQVADGKITRSFGGEASACTSADIAVSPGEGVDLSRKGEDLLGALEGMQGIGQATLYLAESRVEVRFCESTTNEQAIREALGSSGLVSF